MDAVAARLKPPLAVPRRLLRLRSDAILAERFAAGDEAAFAVLYERFGQRARRLHGRARLQPRRRGRAQDRFASLAARFAACPARAAAVAVRVARNAAIDVARRRSGRS